MSQDLTDDQLTPDNDLVPSGNKPLPKPKVTKVYVAIVSLRHNVLKIEAATGICYTLPYFKLGFKKKSRS